MYTYQTKYTVDSIKPNIGKHIPNQIYSGFYKTKYTVNTYQTKYSLYSVHIPNQIYGVHYETKNKVNTTKPNIQCSLPNQKLSKYYQPKRLVYKLK